MTEVNDTCILCQKPVGGRWCNNCSFKRCDVCQGRICDNCSNTDSKHYHPFYRYGDRGYRDFTCSKCVEFIKCSFPECTSKRCRKCLKSCGGCNGDFCNNHRYDSIFCRKCGEENKDREERDKKTVEELIKLRDMGCPFVGAIGYSGPPGRAGAQ